MVRREEFKEVVADGGNLVRTKLYWPAPLIRTSGDHAGERCDFAVELQGVGHRQRIGVAGDGDDVFGTEDFGLFGNFAADFGER